MAARKSFPLRLDPKLYEELRRWADDEVDTEGLGERLLVRAHGEEPATVQEEDGLPPLRLLPGGLGCRFGAGGIACDPADGGRHLGYRSSHLFGLRLLIQYLATDNARAFRSLRHRGDHLTGGIGGVSNEVLNPSDEGIEIL